MLQIILQKRDVLIWKSWGILPESAFQLGVRMMLPSGRVCNFVPCQSTATPALKPVSSEGYKEWVKTYNGTEMLVAVEALN